MAYDVAVVGAGPGGSSTAAALAKVGLSVALIDRSMFPRDKVCGGAVSPRALSSLESMGLLPACASSTPSSAFDSIKAPCPSATPGLPVSRP